MSNLDAYGPDYDPDTHTWPVGVRPTGPECRVCHGAGEIVIDDRPVHTRHPNSNWEPAEPTVRQCVVCDGTGVRPPVLR